MKQYVLGFAFDVHGRLALIKKLRPDWQVGRWNGIGGHIELHETASEAMEREFKEETGVMIPASSWRKVAFMYENDVWQCVVFTAEHADVKDAKTSTDEEVRLFTCQGFRKMHPFAMENLPMLIEACRLKVDHTGTIPILSMEYAPAHIEIVE